MKRVLLIGAVVVVAIAAGCGILDGILWRSELTSAQICAQVNTLAKQEAQCTGKPPETLCADPNEVKCVGSETATKCPAQYKALADCLFVASHGCGEVAGEGEGEGEGAAGEGEGEGDGASQLRFCRAEIAAYSACAGPSCNGNNGNPVNGGCNNDSFCGNGENPQTCASDCQGGNCISGTPDGVCHAGENSVGCQDCNSPCNHNGHCDSGESPQCDDCGQQCPFPTGHCEIGEPAACPDCIAAGCNQDGHCNNSETADQCPNDCEPCSATCDHLPKSENCPACTGGGAQCGNKICEIGEEASCSGDCAGATCTHNNVCDPASGETFQCDDCVRPCTADPQCPASGGARGICDNVNQEFCGGAADPKNCNQQITTSNFCHPECSGTAQCPSSLACTPTAEGVGHADCQLGSCDTATQGCGTGFECVSPLDATTTPGAAGFCALTNCDPIACDPAAGGGCTCFGAASKCATVRDGGAVVNFACTLPGFAANFSAAQHEGDCPAGETSFQGVCRPFCNNVGLICPGGTCQALLGSIGACAP